MIQLSSDSIFGRGGGRDCHFHPDRKDRCLKVTRPDRTPKFLKKEDPWWKRLRPDSLYDQNVRDLKVFQKAWERLKHLDHPGIPETDGLVETNRGLALSVELLRDANGEVCSTLRDHVKEHGLTEEVQAAVEELRQSFIKHKVMVRDPFPTNLVLQRAEDGKLRAATIDGLGDTTLIPIGRFIPSQVKKRVNRKFDRTLKECQKLAAVRNAQS